MALPSRRSAREVFLEALGKAPAERDFFLSVECGEDAGLRGEVDALLTAESDRADSGEAPGSRVGRYELIKLLGEGGFGSVFLAEQHEPVRREVALKIIKLGMDTRQVIARFEAERQALAMMDHPNIAKVLDAGATETGRPYFVMELVRGIPITQYCDQCHCSLRERLAMFVTICQAVQHAHQKGIIHRDIKPSNVLVAHYDGAATPKVIDFGIAKATGEALTQRAMETGVRQVIGTPAYMSPEQAGLGGPDVDTRADVYSLGVLLFELLVGSIPFDLTGWKGKDEGEIRRTIRDVDAPRPSARLAAAPRGRLAELSALRGTEGSKLVRAVRGELDWIVLKALEKDRARRYETASALAADVRCYLEDQPVAAGPPTTGYVLRKFASRNRVALATGMTLLLTLVLGMVGTGVGLMRARAARGRAELALDAARKAQESAERSGFDAQRDAARAKTVGAFLQGLLSSADPERQGGGGNVKVIEVLQNLPMIRSAQPP